MSFSLDYFFKLRKELLWAETAIMSHELILNGVTKYCAKKSAI